MKHLTSLYDLDRNDLEEILSISADLKARLGTGERPCLLQGRMLTLLFEKPSLRTRVSFESAMAQLGGRSVFLSADDAGLKGRESTADIARVLGGYSDAIVLRTFSQSLIDVFEKYGNCPIINGLSDDRHPCQALTDIFTIREVFGESGKPNLVYVGDGNNVAASLAIVSSVLDIPLTVCTPSGYELENSFLEGLQQRYPGSRVTCLTDPAEAVKNADVVYTDVWASMGQESEADERKNIFAPYQVNATLMAKASPECRFMHDLPARRGLEVTDDVMDGPNSIVFRQAENRMHLAKGLLVWLIGKE